MENNHVVGGVREALSPEQQAKILKTFIGQSGEILDQLLRGDLTTEDVQCLIQHRPIVKKGKAACFFFRKSALFPGAEEFNLVNDRFDKFNLRSSLKNSFLADFRAYHQPKTDKKLLAICEFVGCASDAHILKVLGAGIEIGLSELAWACCTDLVESNWTYIAYVWNNTPLNQGDLRVVQINKHQVTREVSLHSGALGSEGWWSSNIRVLCHNMFQPV